MSLASCFLFSLVYSILHPTTRSILLRAAADGAREEYIEAELAKRHNALASSSSARGPGASSSSSAPPLQQSISSGREDTPQTAVPNRPENPRNRALQGQLMEIDLGDEARSRNEALTERARRKLQGESIEDDEGSSGSGRPKKVRLGRDGKPWRPRNRRNSDDIRRDQLVEEILRENRRKFPTLLIISIYVSACLRKQANGLKVDVYETPTPPPASATGANEAEPEGAADDRIAEEFRREFMDAMAQRQQKRKKPANAPPGQGPSGAGGRGAKDEEILKGPKLGGSRNVRAAMRNLLLEKAKEAKKPGR